ncbi:MAG: hypothetical protein AAF761_02955, partial [Pseudomonadota bacterium]
MKLAPFGVLNTGHAARRDNFKWPQDNFQGTEADYNAIVTGWEDDVARLIWPRWENGAWVGAAAAFADDAARLDCEIARDSFQVPELLAQTLSHVAGISLAVPRTERWHYQIEDAVIFERKEACKKKTPDDLDKKFDYRASRRAGSNFIAYSDALGLDKWEVDFWSSAGFSYPDLFGIKERFMRPRPWAAAAALGVTDFRWEVGNGVTHTGVHPSILSGHCIQGLLGACNVVARNPGLLEDIKTLVAQYAVDWGDRRV